MAVHTGAIAAAVDSSYPNNKIMRQKKVDTAEIIPATAACHGPTATFTKARWSRVIVKERANTPGRAARCMTANSTTTPRMDRA